MLGHRSLPAAAECRHQDSVSPIKLDFQNFLDAEGIDYEREG